MRVFLPRIFWWSLRTPAASVQAECRLRGARPLGGEPLEPRLALAASVGVQGFFADGPVTVNTGDINTGTVFTLEDMSTNASKSGYFSALAAGSPVGTWSFTTTVGTSLTFSNPAFGTFQSSTITTESNTVVPSKQRSFYVLGTLTGGTLGPLTPSPAPASITITFNQTDPTISFSATLSIPPTKAKSPVLVAANDIGCDSRPFVYVIDPYTGESQSFNAYPDYGNFRGGVRVAVGDVDGDPNTLEIITAPGPGRRGQVRVFKCDPTNPVPAQRFAEIPSFRYDPFGAAYTRGVEIGVGDIDGDGRDDLVAGASRGPGSVDVTRSTGTTFVSQPSKSFTAFGGTYTGGASVAVGGVGQIVVGSGVGLPPTVKVYNVAGPTPTVFKQFPPQVPTGTGGVSVTTQKFSAGVDPQVMVAGGRSANSAIGVYNNDVNPPTNTFANFAGRPKPNSAVFAGAAALASEFADTVFQAQGFGGKGTILKVNTSTGLADPTFVPTLDGKPIVSPLRVATRVQR